MFWLLVLLAITAATFAKLGALTVLVKVLGFAAAAATIVAVCALLLLLRRRG
jgi:hypothetical protein